MFRSSFLWRIYAGFVGVILVCALIINFLIKDFIQDNANQTLEQDLIARAAFLKELATPAFGDKSRLPHLREQLMQLDKKVDSRFTVINAEGVVLADSRKPWSEMDNHLNRPEIVSALKLGQGKAERFSDTVQQNMKYLALAVQEESVPVGYVRVALPQKQIKNHERLLSEYILAGCVIASIIALLLGFLFARRISLPVTALTESAEAMAQGNYQQRVHLRNRDELGKLAQAFNFMAASANERMEKITEDRNKLSTILSGLTEGVIAIDSEQNIIHINEAAARTLGISASASLGSSVWSTVRIVEIHDILSEVFKKGGICENQVRIPGDKSDTVINVYGASLAQENQGAQGAILVLHDISELEKLENVRRDFVTNASHELKTPLTAIRGMVETILSDPEMEKATLWDFLQRVQNQSDRLVSIVSDLMALSRLESNRTGELGPVSIKAVLNQSIKSFSAIAQEKGSSLSHNLSEVQEDNCRVLGDAHSLGQLFDNLIDNAIKYTPAGGKIDIRLSVDQHNRQAVIEVKDNGLGIKKVDQDRIFERFYRVDKGRSRELGGTGLGLAITRHIVEQHRGHIEVSSEPGQGSTFTIFLPLI